MAGAITLGYQVYLWLKIGQWVPIPLSAALTWGGFAFAPIFDVKWLGLRKILIWVLDLPLSVMLIVGSFPLGYAVGHLVAAAFEGREKVFPNSSLNRTPRSLRRDGKRAQRVADKQAPGL